MLIAGSVVCYLILGNSSRYWWNLPLLVVMSWLANTVRIICISAAAIWISPKFATGEFHMWGGWAVLLLMFCLCWFIFSLQEQKKDPPHGASRMKLSSSLILALCILIYALWNSLELFHSWIGAPYERFSWIFFLLWCAPLVYYGILQWQEKKTICLNIPLLWISLFLSFIGLLGDLNAVKYWGLAFALASFMPWGSLLIIWIAGSISWMPAIGWLGSHDFPGVVFPIRFGIALLASISAFLYLKTCKFN